MWLGIPYTKYGYSIVIPRMFIFCLIISLGYIVISLPETKHFVGSYINLTQHDDVESDDRYYIVFIHGFIYGLLMYLLLRIYNPYSSVTNQVISQKKIIPTI